MTIEHTRIWNTLLDFDLIELQRIARKRFADRLTVRDGVTYLSERSADYGVQEFDDDVRLRDWLYYRMTGTVEGAVLRAAFDAHAARGEG